MQSAFSGLTCPASYLEEGVLLTKGRVGEARHTSMRTDVVYSMHSAAVSSVRGTCNGFFDAGPNVNCDLKRMLRYYWYKNKINDYLNICAFIWAPIANE